MVPNVASTSHLPTTGLNCHVSVDMRPQIENCYKKNYGLGQRAT